MSKPKSCQQPRLLPTRELSMLRVSNKKWESLGSSTSWLSFPKPSWHLHLSVYFLLRISELINSSFCLSQAKLCFYPLLLHVTMTRHFINWILPLHLTHIFFNKMLNVPPIQHAVSHLLLCRRSLSVTSSSNSGVIFSDSPGRSQVPICSSPYVLQLPLWMTNLTCQWQFAE